MSMDALRHMTISGSWGAVRILGWRRVAQEGPNSCTSEQSVQIEEGGCRRSPEAREWLGRGHAAIQRPAGAGVLPEAKDCAPLQALVQALLRWFPWARLCRHARRICLSHGPAAACTNMQ